MNINNRADFRNLILYNRLQEAKQFCEENCEVGVTQAAILSSLRDLTSTYIYDKFQDVVYILTPEDYDEDFEYKSLLRASVGRMFKEQYSRSDITQLTIADGYFLSTEVPRYLNSVPSNDTFFKNLWSCLQESGIDDEIIGMAWVAAINLPKANNE
jgi:hypothetical protein